MSFGASLALASSSSTSGASTPKIGRRGVIAIHSLKSLLSNRPKIFGVTPPKLTRQTIALALKILTALYLLSTAIESFLAHRRQKIDATSEWGRYADKPSSRGMALMMLMFRLAPYWILQGLLVKLRSKYENSGKLEDGSSKNLDIMNEHKICIDESSKLHKLRQKSGSIFATGLLRLGPLYIKIGQILSCRQNLFSDEWIMAMEQLQDRVPAKSGEAALQLAFDAFPGGRDRFFGVFSEFDDVPLAAASLGQVHRARLRSTGELVAIKIQRSRLRDIYDKDLTLMNKIAKMVDCFGGSAGQVGGVKQNWQDIFNDARTILYREIDYRDEAENAIRFSNDFGLGKGGQAALSTITTARGLDGKPLPSASKWLRTPYTYGELSSEKFLVMEYVPSIKISNNAALNKAGITVDDREYLAEALAHSYLRQLCVNQFFSTDPHPGNLGVEVFDEDGSNYGGSDVGGRPPRLVFYDFGQACSLSRDQSAGILEVIESIIDADAKKSISAFQRMGVLVDNADLEKVEKKVQDNYDTGMLKVKKRKKRGGAKYRKNIQTTVDSIGGSALEESTISVNTSNALIRTNTTTLPTNPPSKKQEAEIMSYFTLKSEYAFVARALSQMDGVGKGLDPDFDFISAAAPYMVEIKGARKYLMDEAKKKLKFVYDDDVGMLARQLKLVKKLGFDPKFYLDGRR